MTEALTTMASLCVLLACAETLHGIARTVLVVPRIGLMVMRKSWRKVMSDFDPTTGNCLVFFARSIK